MRIQLLKKLWAKTLMVLTISTTVSSAWAIGEDTKTKSITSAKPKVLMVVSGYGKDQGETQPGFEFDELSKAYLTLRDNGVEIDIASPQGGKVEADKYNPDHPYNKTMLNDASGMAKLANTKSLKDIDANDYQGIFVIGGKGAMFDLPKSTRLRTMIADMYESGATVAAVCHGPAALVDVKLSNGNYLVGGKRVNGFTNQEESLFGKKWAKQFDFQLEDKLKEQGGIFESSPMMLSHVAIDGRLITGQNPTATVDTAKALLKSMGIKPKSGHQYRDDMTLKLVADIIKGSDKAVDEYKNHKENYQPELLGMYGYYSLMVTEEKLDVENALKLMQLAQEDMQHPVISLSIAQAYKKLGQIDAARKEALALLEKHPEMEQAQAFLSEL